MSPHFIPDAPFEPAPGIRSAHAQTIFATLLPSPAPRVGRERWDTPDADFVDVDVLAAPRAAPHLIVFHGLEGSAKSPYVRRMLRLAADRGWGAFALNFRSCSGEPNRLPRSYNAGDTADASLVLERARERVSGPLLAVGFSLGGNVLGCLLAQQGDRCPLTAAALVSVPYDLSECARRLDEAGLWSRVYRLWFLRTMLAKAWGKRRRHPQAFEGISLLRVRSFRGFDDVVTAPIHGFTGAAEYYGQSSSGPRLGQIRTPTLVLSSEDDPLAPASLLPASAFQNPALQLLLTAQGGHVGFVAGSLVRRQFWADRQIFRHFEERLVAPLETEEREPGLTA